MCFKAIATSRAIPALILTLVAAYGTSQDLVYTQAFTQALKFHGLELYKPAEQWLHVAKHRQDIFMDYDLVLENDINDLEIRYRLRGNQSSGNPAPQHVEVIRLLSSISVNDGVSDIRMRIPDEIFARENFNAESVLFADFVPKLQFSNKPFGTFVSMYSEEYGSVDIILLYYDPEMDVLNTFRNLRFIE